MMHESLLLFFHVCDAHPSDLHTPRLTSVFTRAWFREFYSVIKYICAAYFGNYMGTAFKRCTNFNETPIFNAIDQFLYRLTR